MTTTNIRSIDVDFPFEPYKCQLDYMDKVIECLQERKNGILESPTGTGKTLCLLCATLSWRNTFVARMQLEQRMCSEMKEDEKFKENLSNQLQNAAGTWDTSCGNSFFEVPKIIYASRTHSQLCQAIQELKSTVHRPRVSIIGSREQLCIHSDVLKQESNSAKVHMCRAKVSARTCPFYNNLEANKSNGEFNSNILDIEDLVKLGQKHKVCPYYMARELKTSADIIFMPYNYMLDPKSRKAHNLDISGSIVVFDEAHNVEKVCEETVSFDLTSFDIASCIQDVELCMEFLANQTENIDMEEGINTSDIDPEDVKTLKALFSKLEEEIDKIPLPKEGGKSFPAGFMFELMAKVGITPNTKGQVLEVLEKINPLLANDAKGLRGKHFALSKFADSLQTIFRESVPGSSKEQGSHDEKEKSFKVYVKLEPDSKKKQKNLDIWTTGSSVEKRGRTLSYWCFSPGHAMKDLMSHGVRNVILTSGTLSPLNSFTAELQIPFPIRLENPHVIEKHQMWVGVVTKAPDGATLNSSFEFRSTVEYMTGLGNTIANFARTVPNGLLVFFPSYPVMNKCLEHWQNTGIWYRISQHKPMFAEPKGKGDFVQAMEDFYAKINDPNHNGATFFAVCRGKVSEGLDFSDINGRAVVITGLPFPPKMDPKVNLKMEFLDEMLRKDKGAFKGLSGREWYRQQASRAVNQAIGRVIRHKQDYGAILLCDVRFTYPDALQQLPSWVRPHVKIFKEFGHVQRELIQFFRNADKLVDKKCMKNKQVVQAERPVVTELATTSDAASSCCTGASSSCRTESAMQFTSRQPAMRQQLDRRENLDLKAKPRTKHEGPVSLARLSVEFDDPKPVCSMPAKRIKTSLLDSLNTSEVAQNSRASITDQCQSIKTLSDSIVGSRVINQRPRTKIKVVKHKSENVEEKKTVDPKAQKLQAAKEYVVKVRKALSGENYKTFSQVLAKYKENNDLPTLLHGLTPLFTQNSSMYELFLGFSSYVRDPDDKVKFFNAFKEITGQEVPQHYLNGLRTKKRSEPEYVLRPLPSPGCGGTRCTTAAAGVSSLVKILSVRAVRSFQAFITKSLAGNAGLQTHLLDAVTHLNGGKT